MYKVTLGYVKAAACVCTIGTHCAHILSNQRTNQPADRLTPWSQVRLENPVFPLLLKKFSAFYQPEGSILCPHKPATRSCPEPDQSSPRKPILFEINFNIILQSTPRPSKWSLSFRFLHQNSVCTSLISHTCHQHRQSHCWYLITLIIFAQDATYTR